MGEVEAPPMEETIGALIDFLVAPLLPRRISSRETRTSEAQELALGKQMHAVVLLSNYFHRKHFPELEFLDFENFCKASIMAKPSLLPFMTYNNQKGQQTIVENMISEAFDICTGLNSLTTHAHKEGWPVSKVSVFLVDSVKKNCVLVSDSVTQGVWSLIETDVGTFAKHGSVAEEQKSDSKKIFRGSQYPRVSSSSTTLDEATLLQSAYSAVKEKTGLDPANLVRLDSQYVYSLTKPKTTTQFYLMQSSRGIDGQVSQIPVADVINSLQGPVVVRVSDGYETTQVAAFFHLLPYERMISTWFPRQNTPLMDVPKGISSRSPCKVQNASVSQQHNQGKLTPSRESSEGLKVHLDTTKNLYKEAHKPQKSEPSLGVLDRPTSVGSMMDPPMAKLVATTTSKDQDHAQPSIMDQKQGPEVLGISNFSVNDAKDKFGTTILEPKPEDTEDLSKPIAEVAVDGSGVCFYDDITRNDLSIVQYPADLRNVDSFPLVPSSKKVALLQASLKVLRKKRANLLHQRQQLLLQQRDLEDAMAICDGSMHTIMAGGDGAYALMFETVLESASLQGEDTSYQSHDASEDIGRDTKRKRLSEATLSLRNSCEDLDEICKHNNWVLPTYTVVPSRGGFVASVTVQGADFSCTANGVMQGKPVEARESAATSMMNKLHSMVHQG